MTARLVLTLALGVAGCGLRGNVVARQVPAAPAEQGRIAEAQIAAPITEGTITYDIWYSGFFPRGGAIDLAVLRELCRPGVLAEVSEREVPGIGMLTGLVYTPRQVSFRCAAP
ncbi:MAG TPA: hypothetical protein VM513_16795 [Kofleriaceae bacterium]|jgi:hypothetical protein|nr:hypothetical protein [Kofleriaceae bacterium]